MLYLMTVVKAATLAWTLTAGSPALCPDQVEGLDDEELNCEVLAVTKDVVILKEVF